MALQGAAAGLTRTMGGDVLPPLLVTFGLAVIIQTGFSTYAQKLLSGAVDTASLEFSAHHPGLLPLLTLAVAVGLILGLECLLSAARLGRAFRATSDDPESARVIGVKTPHVFALAMARSLPLPGCVWLRGGDHRRNGLVLGTLAGGILLGVARAFGATISPQAQDQAQVLTGRLDLFAVLALRPRHFRMQGVRFLIGTWVAPIQAVDPLHDPGPGGARKGRGAWGHIFDTAPLVPDAELAASSLRNLPVCALCDPFASALRMTTSCGMALWRKRRLP